MLDLGSLEVIIVFLFSLLIGRVFSIKLPGFVFQGIVLVLVWSISAWAAASGIEALKVSLYHTVIFLVLIILFVFGIGSFYTERSRRISAHVEARPNYPIIIAIASGWLTGIYANWLQAYLSQVIWPLVLAVIFVTGLAMHSTINLEAIRNGGEVFLKALSVTLVSAFLAGIVASIFLRVPLRYSLSILFGLGWYSFAGPFVAQFFGPSAGLTAFLVNILREQATFILTPLLSRFKVATISLGGATTMDNTLSVFIYTYGEEAAVPSIMHGFVLTFIVPLLDSIVVMLPI
jgi:uncharacterized membrane protein YbjE (DUF340 family)